MAGNDWVNSYLEAILDVGQPLDDARPSLLLRERGRFTPSRYFVEEVITGYDETDLHRSWVKAVATRSPQERNTRLENMCWRIWNLARQKKQHEEKEAQRLAKRRLERERGRREATADMSEEFSEGEKGDLVSDVSTHGTKSRLPRINSAESMEIWANQQKGNKLYLVLISLHGLIRGENMELGRDSDTGGQVKYVVELARALGSMPGVYRVDLLTRQVSSPDVDWSYGEPTEMLTPRDSEDYSDEMGESSGAYIVRIPFGPKDKYIPKELLWPHIAEFVDGAMNHIMQMSSVLGEQVGGGKPIWPSAIHGHYADAGDAAALLSGALNVPMILTGHSLGRDKLEQLLKQGRLSKEEINSTYKIMRRIEGEELSLDVSEMVITSTRQEIDEQWRLYDGFDPILERKLRARIKRNVSCYGRFMPRMVKIPPGMEFNHIVPHDGDMEDADGNEEHPTSRDPPIWAEIMRFFSNSRKPMILALARPDPKKNITTLVKAFGECRPLRDLANLALIMGNRDGIDEMSSTSSSVLLSVLKLIDKYDLYGQVAYPKHHKQSDVPDIYRLAAKSKGVFINPAFIEPFGLTLIEAAAHGLPMVATKNGGPVDIHRVLDNGLLVDPHDQQSISEALLKLVADKQLWAKCRQNGLKNIHQFSWPEHCKTYLSRITSFKPRHPQWQSDDGGDNSEPESPSDSLRDIQDISLNLRFSFDGGSGNDGSMNQEVSSMDRKSKIEAAVLNWSKGKDSRKMGSLEKSEVNSGKFPAVRRRKFIVVIALDFDGERDTLEATRRILEAVEKERAEGTVGFILSTSLTISEIQSFLVSGGLNPNDFDAFVCNSGSAESQFVDAVKRIVRGKRSWEIALSRDLVARRLKPTHVEEILIETLDEPKLSLRFFNFLGLHRGFDHSTASFCILIHALVKANLFWPASSLLQTLLLRGLNPSEAFHALYSCYEKCKLSSSSSSSFDLLIQHYVRIRRALDGVLVFRMMTKAGLLPEVRTLSALLHGLVHCRHYGLAMEVFEEMTNAGVRPDVYIYSGVVHSLCELKDLSRAREMIVRMEESGCDLSIVPYNVLINGLCKKQMVWEAVEVKNSLSRKELKADVVTYCSLIHGLCKVQEFEVGLEMMDEMLCLSLSPSEAAVSSLVKGLRKREMIEEVFNLVKRIAESDASPNLFVHNALLDLLCKCRKFDEAELVFDRMGKIGLCPNVVTYSVLIDMFCRRGKLDTALSFLGKMIDSGLKPTVYPYNSLINGHCKFGDISAAENFMAEIINKKLEPTVVTYTSLMGGYCSKGKTHNALRLYHEMTGKGIAPSLYTFTTLISGLFRGGLIPDAVKLFNEMEEWNIKPNRVTYNVMIEGYCEEGDIAKAFVLQSEMMEKGIAPDTYTYRSLIHGLCSTGRASEAKEFVDGLHKENHELNEICYTTLLHGFCREGRLEEALSVCQEMVQRGVDLDLVCYGVLIDGSLKHKDRKMFLGLVKEMHDRGLKPDDVMYTSMIDAKSKTGDFEEAFGIWDLMINEGCVPNEVTYTTVINGLCKAGFVNEAEILRSKMLIPNQVTYGCFLDILTKGEGDMKRALELHDAILKGLLANTATYNMLIRGFCRQGRMDEASELLTKMTGDGVSPDCITYTTMIYEFCRKSDVKKAIELWNSMMERGVRPDRVAYNTMIHGCCVLGEMEKAIELRSEMLRQGLKPNSKTSGTSILNDSSSKS